jgi:arylsulfatase A-like enzyme
LPAGQTPDTLISVVDYAPTLLGLMDVPVPAEMNGLDLSATILGRSDREPSSVFLAEYLYHDQPPPSQPWRGVRTKRYTYARWLQGGAVLFDDQQDPYQARNLILEPEYAGLAAELEQELQGWLTKLNDDFVAGAEHIRQLGQWEEWQIREEHFIGRRAVATRPAW